MKRLGLRTLAAFPAPILNTHPALLPKFAGQGMFGDRVFEAVLARGRVGVRGIGASCRCRVRQWGRGPSGARSRPSRETPSVGWELGTISATGSSGTLSKIWPSQRSWVLAAAGGRSFPELQPCSDEVIRSRRG